MATRILIVDDYEDCREIVALQLQNLGYDVIEAMSGEEGLEKALGQRPDVIIMDLCLPGLSGIETAAKLKAYATTRHIPLVAYTAWDGGGSKARARDAGIVEVLVKPTSAQQLDRTIQKLLTVGYPDLACVRPA